VLVNEAVNLGIAIYNMRQGEGIRYETLFRDETVGALDAANGKEYVRMLRRAMDLGGFHQVIFICHLPLVWEQADRALEVRDGCVFTGGEEPAIAACASYGPDSGCQSEKVTSPRTHAF
jgi:energy-coupling factor transporter ATP-binding protein EcfA2